MKDKPSGLIQFILILSSIGCIISIILSLNSIFSRDYKMAICYISILLGLEIGDKIVSKANGIKKL